jgi:hypothetical protein
MTECTDQQWVKKLKDEPEWSIFEKQTNNNKRTTGIL